MKSPISFVTVAVDGLFWVRLLVERIRALVGPRDYEIIVVDRLSRDGTRAWLRAQPDIRIITRPHWPWHRDHRHGEAAEAAIRRARHDRIVLLDSDAHPVAPDWLENTADRLDDQNRLAGAVFRDHHRGNPHGWYIHPHFMAFLKADLESLIILRKRFGPDTDTAEESTMRVLAAGRGIIGHPIEFAPAFAVGHDRVPTIAGGVFHAWYVSRLTRNEAEVVRETNGQITTATYRDPLIAKLRQHYALTY